MEKTNKIIAYVALGVAIFAFLRSGILSGTNGALSL